MNSLDSKKNSNKNLLIVAGIAIALLLGLNAYLFNNKSMLSKNNVELTEENMAMKEAEIELEANYQAAMSDLEELRGSNAELNALIDEQKAKIKKQKAQIKRNIRNGANLKKAKEEIALLTTQVSQYVAEINDLKAANANLTHANEGLTKEKAILISQVDSSNVVNQGLVTEKNSLSSLKDKLTSENNMLNQKVTAASAIKALEIKATPVKVRKSGKEVKKRSAKSVNKVNVCFNADANRVTEGGTETFYVRIINPMGETMAIENMGSGVLTSSDTDGEVRYTISKDIQYDNKPQNDVCVAWDPGTEFMAGVYEVEIYNKGYVTGRTSFELK